MVIDELFKRGIKVRNGYGEQRVLCPECSYQRRKKGDRCLAVKIENDGAIWHCWHCGFSGGVSDRVGRETRNKPPDLGGSWRHMRY